MRGLSKLWLCLITAGFMSAANADIIIDQQTLPNASILSYDISVVDGAYTISITTVDGWTLEPTTPVDCDVTPDDPVCQTPPPPPVDCNVTPNDPSCPPPPPPPAGLNVTLTASTDLAEINDTVFFTWSANEATFCDTKWGNAQWKNYVPDPAGGTVGITMSSLGETQFRMFCENSATGEAQAVGVFVNVQNIVVNPNCAAPEVWNGSEVSWFEYLGAGYPQVSNAEQRKFLGRSDYVAVKFNTGNADVAGLFQTIQISDPNRFVAVNRCPGRFTDADPGCYDRQANGSEIQWSTDGSFGNCALQKNTDYYLNITYVNVETGGNTVCDASSCAFNLKVVTQEN